MQLTALTSAIKSVAVHKCNNFICDLETSGKGLGLFALNYLNTYAALTILRYQLIKGTPKLCMHILETRKIVSS